MQGEEQASYGGKMTEAMNPLYAGLHSRPSRELVEVLLDGQKQAVSAIDATLDNLAEAVEMAASRLQDGTGRLVYVGAGTSGRLAVLDGSELTPNYGWPRERLVFLMAGGLAALTVSAEGAEDEIEAGAQHIRDNQVSKNDVVICVAASGRTPYTFGALEAAKAAGALTIGVINNPDTPIYRQAAYGLLAETGAEFPAGSTRMKAGTAQKIMLNLLSTAIMTRLGHVYQGYMVDMIPSNAKLRKRAVAMVANLADCEDAAAKAALAATGFQIKTAILVAKGMDQQEAEMLLRGNNQNLHTAILTRPKP